VQVPAARLVTVLPLIVQMLWVWLVKVTARPEVAVAVALAVVMPPTASVDGLKLIAPMVWFIFSRLAEQFAVLAVATGATPRPRAAAAQG